MPLLILLVLALVAGYLLARSKYHKPVDKALALPKKWWDQLFHRSNTSETMTTTNSQEEEEN